MHSSEPFVAQHHSDLIVKHQNQTPIVALVDRSGGVWWSVAGSEIPTNERSLASTLSTAYSATLKAASEPPQPSYPSPGYPSNLRPPVQPAQAYAMPAQRDSGSYFLERSGVSAPDPVRLPALNANSTHAIRTTVAADASSALAIIAAVAIACSIILAAGPVIGSNVIAHAITEDNDQPSDNARHRQPWTHNIKPSHWLSLVASSSPPWSCSYGTASGQLAPSVDADSFPNAMT